MIQLRPSLHKRTADWLPTVQAKRQHAPAAGPFRDPFALLSRQLYEELSIVRSVQIPPIADKLDMLAIAGMERVAGSCRSQRSHAHVLPGCSSSFKALFGCICRDMSCQSSITSEVIVIIYGGLPRGI